MTNRIVSAFVCPIEVRVVEAGPGHWCWRVAEGADAGGGHAQSRETAWACAMSALRGLLLLRRLRALP